MTKQELKNNFPGLYNQVYDMGKKYAEKIFYDELNRIFSEAKGQKDLFARLEEFVKHDPVETFEFIQKFKDYRRVK